MVSNFYFSNYENSMEQSLIEDLIIETIRIYGHNVYYVDRKINSVGGETGFDDLLNEDDMPIFDEAYLMEMYIKNVEGFEGEGDFLSKFGLQIRDSITFTVALRIFNAEVGMHTEDVRPQEGDLIYLPLNNKAFEIKHVEHESIFYQMGQLQTYDLKCELFEYSNERFETGIVEIDDLFENYTITSNTAVANVETVSTWAADNEVIQREGDSILDFSEINPFGENEY